MKQRNRGVALVTVLVIVFIVMTIISNIMVRNYKTIRRLTNQKIMEQSYGILFAAIDFARAGLATSSATQSFDSNSDIWAQPIPKTELLDGMFMGGYIIDEQSKFNINDLITYNGQINQTVLDQFNALLGFLNLPQGLGLNIAYYIAAPQYQASIMDSYVNAKPSYRPSGKGLVDLSELILVKGMQPSWVSQLNEYVTAIPMAYNATYINQQESNSNQNVATAAPIVNGGLGSIQVNVNTASAEVIAAKAGVPLTLAQRIVTQRDTEPFQSLQDLTNYLAQSGVSISSGNQTFNIAALSTTSSYFTVHAVIDKGEYEFKWLAMLFRPNRSGQWPQVLWQHPE